jgi:hypothetical protein
MCYHSCARSVKNKIVHDGKNNSDFTFDFSDTVYIKKGATLSMLFRNNKKQLELFKAIMHPTWFGDWQLEQFLLVDGSRGFFFSEVMGVYRIHDNGLMNTYFSRFSTLQKIKMQADWFTVLLNMPKSKFHQKHLKYQLLKLYLQLAKHSNNEESKEYSKKVIRIFLSNFRFNILVKRLSPKCIVGNGLVLLVNIIGSKNYIKA